MKTILVDAVDGFTIEHNGTYKIFKEMYDLLETFPNRKIILTGATKDEGFKEYGLDNMPYEVFTLEHNPEKTDPEYYKKMLENFGLNVSDVVCFDHDPNAVKSAKAAGITSFHYDSQKRDLVSLKKFLEDNLS